MVGQEILARAGGQAIWEGKCCGQEGEQILALWSGGRASDLGGQVLCARGRALWLGRRAARAEGGSFLAVEASRAMIYFFFLC